MFRKTGDQTWEVTHVDAFERPMGRVEVGYGDRGGWIFADTGPQMRGGGEWVEVHEHGYVDLDSKDVADLISALQVVHVNLMLQELNR